MPYRLIREVTPDERAAWTAKRATALAKDRTRYVRAKAAYDGELASYAKMSRETQRSFGVPVRRVEPTEVNFDNPAAELDNIVDVSPGRGIGGDKGDFAYLVSAAPGTFRLYGPIFGEPNGATGACLCVGSVRVAAPSGVITDLGAIKPATPGPNGDRGLSGIERVVHAGQIVPPTVATLTRVPARFAASPKMSNYFGLLIDRMAPLPGVPAYQCDEATGEPLGGP